MAAEPNPPVERDRLPALLAGTLRGFAAPAAPTVCSALCWRRILTRPDILFFKIAGLVISAIPFLGPAFFLFFDMPPRLPKDAQVDWSARSGTTSYSERFTQLYRGNRKYLRRKAAGLYLSSNLVEKK